MARLYLDTKATQREERDQRTIGRCGTRVVPVSTNRHRRPPPMPGPIHRSGLAKRRPSKRRQDRKILVDPILSFLLLRLALLASSPSLLPPPRCSSLHGGRATSCQLSMHHLDGPNLRFSRPVLSFARFVFWRAGCS